MATSTSRTPGPGGASASSAAPASSKSAFETQRAALIAEIGVSFEHVLQNINKLNRALEGIIAVGNEFSSVEALWSQFEGVMGKDVEEEEGEGEGERDGEEDGSAEENIQSEEEGRRR